MIKDNQVHLNRAHVIVDGLLVAGSYALSYYLKFESIFADKVPVGRLSIEVYFSALYFLVPAYLFLYYIVQLYTSRRALRLWNEFVDIVQANIMGVIGFLVVLYLQFIKAEEDMCDCYARGFDDGREWRRHEVEWAQDEIAEIKSQLKGLSHED